MKPDIRYMKRNRYTEEFMQYDKQSYKRDSDLSISIYEDCVILPCIPDPDRIWGAGGVVDAKGMLVPESRVRRAFGKAYGIEGRPGYVDETVVFIPCIPNHWGHFLLDVVSRLWYALECGKQYRIAFCLYHLFPEGKLIPNMLEFFKYLGYGEDRLIMVREPLRIKRILIPEPAMLQEDIWYYHPKYMTVIDRVRENALRDVVGLKAYERVYFTRLELKKAKFNEVGEKLICRVFEKNGYKIFAPERLSLKEQIFYIHSCKYMACLSGTIPHNIVFADERTEVANLNRTSYSNSLQVVFNHMTGIRCVNVDVYRNLKKPSDYGSGPFWVEYNENLHMYLKDLFGHPFTPSRKDRTFSVIKSSFKWILCKIVKRIKANSMLRCIYHRIKH